MKKKDFLIGICFMIGCIITLMIGHKAVHEDTYGNDDVKSEAEISETEVSELETIETEAIVKTTEQITGFNFIDDFDSLSLDGYAEVDNSVNPYEKTIAHINDESVGDAIFMTSGTGFSTRYQCHENDTLVIRYRIHPWMSEVSDGMKLQILITDESGELINENIEMSPTDDFLEKEIDLSACAGKSVNVHISAESGENTDGDWAVIKEAKIKDSTRYDDKLNFSLKNEKVIGNVNVGLEIVNNISSPIIENGNEDEWDCSDVLNPSVIKFDGKYFNYYSGYNGEIWQTGLAVSNDGVNWEKYENNPILTISDQGWDSQYIAANGSAIVIDDMVYYYYQGSNEKGKAQIGLAVSEDGYTFEKKGICLKLSEDEWDNCGVADPYVIEFNGHYYMYYLGMNDVYVQRLGIAYSDDGINWIKYNNNPILDVGAADTFDENGLGEPSVIFKDDMFYMIYTGRNKNEQRNIGLAVSYDGVNFKKMNTQGIFENRSDWNSEVICDTTLMLVDDDIWCWYGGGNVASPDQELNGKIGYIKIVTYH